MFRMKKNEQNEDILYLSSILNYHIMFTIFKFHPRNRKTQKTQKFFSKNEQNNEHYKQLNPKVKFGG